MKRKTTLAGKRFIRGERLTHGKGWRLLRKGGNRVFMASLIQAFRIKGERIAIFRIL